MNIIVLFFPMILWFVIVFAIVTVVKSNFSGRRKTRGSYGSYSQKTPRSQSYSRPQPEKGIFEAKPVKKAKKSSFGNTDFDDYSAKGRKKDFVGGYNKKYTDKRAYRHAREMQYSHTYSGHEPWDKCLPKEKDPWEKGFYTD